MSPSLNVSKLTVTSFSYKWPTQIGCWTCSSSACVKSPIFPSDTEEANVQWQIKVAKAPNTDDYELTMSALSKNISSVRASFDFDMQTEEGDAIAKHASGFKMYSFDTTAAPGWKECVSFPKFCQNYAYVRKNRVSILNKALLIFCSVHIVDDQKDAPSAALFFKVPACNLGQDLEALLATGKNADVTLVAKDNEQKIRAHKVILKARSPVFDAMFSNQLSENLDNLVVIKDLDHEVLDKMIQFMYTGKASNLANVADRLLMAADKYDLPVLRVLCEQEMGINLSVENAAQTLVLADLHHGIQLKKCTLNFIKRHAQRVFATNAWQEIKVKHPNLLADVCESLATMQLED